VPTGAEEEQKRVGKSSPPAKALKQGPSGEIDSKTSLAETTMDPPPPGFALLRVADRVTVKKPGVGLRILLMGSARWDGSLPRRGVFISLVPSSGKAASVQGGLCRPGKTTFERLDVRRTRSRPRPFLLVAASLV